MRASGGISLLGKQEGPLPRRPFFSPFPLKWWEGPLKRASEQRWPPPKNKATHKRWPFLFLFHFPQGARREGSWGEHQSGAGSPLLLSRSGLLGWRRCQKFNSAKLKLNKFLSQAQAKRRAVSAALQRAERVSSRPTFPSPNSPSISFVQRLTCQCSHPCRPISAARFLCRLLAVPGTPSSPDAYSS